jgi:hypothetical protein
MLSFERGNEFKFKTVDRHTVHPDLLAVLQLKRHTEETKEKR